MDRVSFNRLFLEMKNLMTLDDCKIVLCKAGLKPGEVDREARNFITFIARLEVMGLFDPSNPGLELWEDLPDVYALVKDTWPKEE